ncbi:hypothetical protein MIND_01325300 [Mycena indigotica]|uniref:Uncharacterized protein n=1 Tax=Mycena indigotica TaxID=2126181 RepID=A0A8H6S188_9AGAR|nr:uncharacterized protein MIND_01325300 [Mycena indigotica]KAF7290841.1 hypothetical protein MIND_01325300 [Mycena indigotica]
MLKASHSIRPSESLHPRQHFHWHMAHFLRVALAVSVTVLALLRIWPTTQWHCHFESEPIPHSDLRSADDPRLEAYGDPATAISCKSLSDQDSISLSLPSDAALLFFLSRGPISGQFRLSKDATALSNSVELTVSTEDASLEAQICRMGSDTANEHGLLLWANPEEPRPTIKVLITVQLPTYEFFYQDFSAHLPFFAYDIDDLWTQYAAFEILRLKTVDAEITYEGLLASSIFLQTSNANVSGFSDGYELDVCTSNAAIEAISRFQAEEPGQVLRLNLKTSIGQVKTHFDGVLSQSANRLAQYIALLLCFLHSRILFCSPTSTHLLARSSSSRVSPYQALTRHCT